MTTEYFSWANKSKGKFQLMCKECFKKYMHERWLKIKEEDGDRLQRINDSRKKYEETRMDRIRESHRRYRENNLEKERERCRKKALVYYYEHKDEINAKKKEYRVQYRKEHSKEITEHFLERYHNDPLFKFTVRMRNMINASFTRYETYKPKKNIDVIGMPSAELRDYLLETFRDTYGYDWDFVEPTEIDHIIPLSSAKTEEDIAKLCHYTNLRLIKATDNRYKGCKMDYQIGACQ